MIILGILIGLLIAIPFFWGVADMLQCYKFISKKEVDYTAGVLWWWSVKHFLRTRTKELIAKLPWIGQDLSEALGLKEDDNVTS